MDTRQVARSSRVPLAAPGRQRLQRWSWYEGKTTQELTQQHLHKTWLAQLGPWLHLLALVLLLLLRTVTMGILVPLDLLRRLLSQYITALSILKEFVPFPRLDEFEDVLDDPDDFSLVAFK